MFGSWKTKKEKSDRFSRDSFHSKQTSWRKEKECGVHRAKVSFSSTFRANRQTLREWFTYPELLNSFRAIVEEVEDESDGSRRSLMAAEEKTEQEIAELLGVEIRLLEDKSQEIAFSDFVPPCFLLLDALSHQPLNRLQNRLPRLKTHIQQKLLLSFSTICFLWRFNHS